MTLIAREAPPGSIRAVSDDTIFEIVVGFEEHEDCVSVLLCDVAIAVRTIETTVEIFASVADEFEAPC